MFVPEITHDLRGNGLILTVGLEQVVASSVGGDTHTLGSGTLPAGVDAALCHMKAGEQAFVEAAHPYCGAQPAQQLTGTMTLLSFVRITDLSPDQNRGLLLRSIELGPDPTAFKSPKAFTKVRVHLSLAVLPGRSDVDAGNGSQKLLPPPEVVWGTRPPHGDGEPMEVTLDDDDGLPLPGIETALRTASSRYHPGCCSE
eukprot:COSAG05_NODE_604_length_8399_cov_6.936145_8_plen_199_part_00